MSDYFTLVADEFHARSRQLREFVSTHGPSIGTANEVLIRDFLQTALPKWVSVGHGFVLTSTEQASRETDILVYRSLLYAPLFGIRDFVVVPPESVVAAIEVKTRVSQASFHDALWNLISMKRITPDCITSLFIYNPPSLACVERYLKAFDFSDVASEHFPDFIYGLSRFAFEAANIVEADKREGRGYVDFTPKNQTGRKDFIFEKFFYDLYRRIEVTINQDLKNGIDNVWRVSEGVMASAGRLKYSGPSDPALRLVTFSERKRTGPNHALQRTGFAVMAPDSAPPPSPTPPRRSRASSASR